ncbi:MAG TPA: S41 family peptidase [Pyrinomonadaceae bacterium]|nr:S41 family peptidase [Pyrinomonadaceae bacterium]
MKRTGNSVAAAFVLLSLVPAARAQEAAPPTPEERAFIAAKIYSSVNTYFAHWQAVPGLDFDAEFKRYLGCALKADTRLAFDLATAELFASLRNGHTQFIDRGLYGGASPQAPVAARVVEGRWVVTRSLVEAVKPGDEILMVDDKPIEEFFRQSRKYIAASDERSARRSLFFRPYVWPDRYTLTLGGGRRVSVDRAALKPAPQPSPETEGRWLKEGELAYVKIPGFGEPRFEQKALEFVRRFKDAGALIIDVRGNGGGSTPQELTKALMGRPYRWWAEATPQTLAVLKYRGEYHTNTMMTWGGETIRPGEPVFKGRLVILADGGCGSACEDFVMPFKDNGRATVIGERTAGSTGQPYLHDFGNGMMIVVGSIRTSFPDGSPFEGVGIAPDIEMPATVKDLMEGTDAVLQRAVEEAGKPR